METVSETNPLHPQTALRPPDTVMRLERMGSFFPTRLSFMRSTIRRLAAEKPRLDCPVWEMDEEGFGRAVYTLTLWRASLFPCRILNFHSAGNAHRPGYRRGLGHILCPL